jgi:biopolymer transport protein ExbD
MARRRRRRKGKEEVELNLAAMLDMAFQLLAFFVLTFKPNPVEGQFSLRLPPPAPVTNVGGQAQAGSDVTDTDPVAALDSLIISVIGDQAGNISSLAIGEGNLANLQQLETQLRIVLSDPSTKFEQVIIQVGDTLRYNELMRVIDVCTRQTLPNGQKLSKLSFVELPTGAAAAP